MYVCVCRVHIGRHGCVRGAVGSRAPCVYARETDNACMGVFDVRIGRHGRESVYVVR